MIYLLSRGKVLNTRCHVLCRQLDPDAGDYISSDRAELFLRQFTIFAGVRTSYGIELTVKRHISAQR